MFALFQIVHNEILRNSKHHSIVITNIIIILYTVVKVIGSNGINKSRQCISLLRESIRCLTLHCSTYKRKQKQSWLPVCRGPASYNVLCFDL